ncbi:hypothetical protein AAFF_G00294910 [Aldrovandia affinis]|uniref:Synaptonemal complex protein 2 n=1 Tax=Aldrovandia affinis TaxID=143900 RepID=A0AAD7W166_9TELE|nr:hypothetical protein AAFF_G00294910 [Aldrovandia affinis]
MGLIHTLERCLNRMQTVGLIHTLEQCLNRMQTVGLIHTLEQCLNRMQTVGLIHTLEQCLNRMQTVGLIHTLEQCLNRMQTVGLIHTLEQCLNRMQTVGLIHTLEQCLNRMQTVGLIHTLEQCLNRMQTLERLIDEALKRSDFQTLEELLRDEGNQRINLKCSKQFINKLDKLINRWYERCHQMWVEAGAERSESLLILAEDFFDALLVVHETKKEGICQVTESFLHHIGLLAADSRVHVMIQKEAIRKLNLILEKISSELKKDRKILLSAEISVVMKNLACRILEGGDYDLQVALMEALCRMTNREQRKELADRWFPMEFVATAFSTIQDSEFETLLMPMDEKLEEFWIDFNVGSQSMSFYFSLAKDGTQDGQWDTICVPENEVHCYTVEEARGNALLKLTLTEPLCVGSIEGSELHIYFSQSLDILQAVSNVYGNAKNKRFVGKSSCSVVKTMVQIILDESSSQAVVPESQVAQALVVDRDLCGTQRSACLPLPPSQEESAGRALPPQAKQRPLQALTPVRRKMSESSTFVSSSGRRTPSTSLLFATPPVSRAKVRPALDLISSLRRNPALHIRESEVCGRVSRQTSGPRQTCGPSPAAERFRRVIPVDRVMEMVQTEHQCEEQLLDDDTNMVPDSQPVWSRKRPLLSPQEVSESSRKRISVSERAGPVEMSDSVRRFISNQYKSEPGSVSHYTPTAGSRSKVGKSWTLTPKEKGAARFSGFLKSPSDCKQTAEQPGYDVFDFDSPKSSKLKGIPSPKRSVVQRSSQGPRNLSQSARKSRAVKPVGRRVKKHLFSDSDTDNKTDISWLKESGRKPRPKVVDYSRQETARNQAQNESTVLPSPSPEVLEQRNKRKKKKGREEREKTAPPAGSRQCGRPQRSTATSRNYREASESSSSSQSECEERATRKPKQKQTNGSVEVKMSEQLEMKRKQPLSHPEGHTGAQREPWAARFSSFSRSPPPIERMRSVGSPVSAAGSAIRPLHSLRVTPPDAPSLLLDEDPFRGIEASSFSRPVTGSALPPLTTRGHAVPTPLRSPLLPLPPPSPPVPPPSPPLLTSTAREGSAVSAPNSPLPHHQLEEFGDSQGRPTSLDKESLLSVSPQNRSSQKSVGLEKLPSSPEPREAAQLRGHRSGPNFGVKRRPSLHVEEEEEEEEGERKSQTPPPIGADGQGRSADFDLSCHPKEEESSFEEEVVVRQGPRPGAHTRAPLQKECIAVAGGDGEVRSVVSSRVVSHVWEAEGEGPEDLDVPEFSASHHVSSMCRHFNSQLQRKFQNRSKRMDLFVKQSLKTVQQHASSVSVQVHQYRSQTLEKTKAVLLEEIRSLEQDDSNLRTMEKDLTTYWRKQTQAFRSYQERETTRLQRLRNTFQKSACPSLEYEERIFTSEMCLMREDMRSVQDKLYKDMQEEELQGVRRGLQALFLPEGRRL